MIGRESAHRLVIAAAALMTAAAATVELLSRRAPPPAAPPEPSAKAPAMPAAAPRGTEVVDPGPLKPEPKFLPKEAPRAPAFDENARPELVSLPRAAAPALLAFQGAPNASPEPVEGRDPEPGRAKTDSTAFLRPESGLREVDPPADVSLPKAEDLSPGPPGRASFFSPSGLPRFGVRVVRDTKAWSKLASTLDFHDMPWVDFGKKMAIILFSGDIPKGRLLWIVSAKESGGKIQVFYEERAAAPAELELHTKGPWRPYQILLLPRSKLPVSYKKIR